MGLGGMLGTLVGTLFGTESLKMVSNIKFGMGEAFKKPTETFIGLGILGNAAKNTKDRFRLK